MGQLMLNEIEIARGHLTTLLETERAPYAEINAYQGELLSALYSHAQRNAPFYQTYPDLEPPINPRSTAWRGLPFVSRHDLARHRQVMQARHMPMSHGLVQPVQSGGSTGQPIQVALSALESVARIVNTYRMFIAWGLDVARPLFMIRKPQVGSERRDGIGFRKWGFPWLPEEELGLRSHLDISTPPVQQLAEIAREAPAYVNTLPSNILRLAIEARTLDHPPHMPYIISVAEFLPKEVRALAERTFGSRVINVLSSSEGGVIAIECPVSGLLHIQCESVLAEIINADGSPCQCGEIGELVVTPFYNYATPLIRYRSGDFVEQGPDCPCGRTLPTIARVVGRREHMFSFPDGRNKLPEIDRVRISEIVGHQAWVFAQTAPTVAELRVAQNGHRSQESELLSLLKSSTSGLFSVSLKEVEGLPLTSGGKRHFSVNAIV
jgi:phenylacetate-CoA ligase